MNIMTDIEERLAGYVAEISSDDIPPEIADSAVMRLGDTVVCMVAGLRSAECAALAEALRRRGGKEESTAIGVDRLLPAGSAALLNGALAHWCEWDDLHDGAIIHASAVIWPVLLAVAEAEGLDGRDGFDEVLAGAVAAYDVAGRIGEVLTPLSPNGWYSTSVACAAGAAAGAARLSGLKTEGILSAMGLAATACALLRQPILDRASGKNALCAQTASAIMTALDLAKAGISGARTFLVGDYGLSLMLTGQRAPFDAAVEDLGRRFSVAEISVKPYPCCRATHPSVDLALALREQADASTIDRIEISVCEPMFEVVGRPFEPGDNPRMAALFSIPYTVASALIHGRVDLDTFDPACIEADHAARDLAGRIHVSARPIPPGTTMYQVPVALSATMKNGKEWSLSTTDVLGSPAKPLTTEAMSRKMASCAKGALSQDEAGELEKWALSVRQAGLAPVMSLVRGARYWRPDESRRLTAAE